MTHSTSKPTNPEPLYKSGQIVLIKGDKRRWKVPGEADYPEKCNWEPRNCIDCSIRNWDKKPKDKELCLEYVLMELDQLDLPIGSANINTHVCEKRLKLAKEKR